MKMYNNMCAMDNHVVNFVGKRARNDCSSFIGSNLRYAAHYVSNTYVANVEHLCELIACRDGLMDLNGFPMSFINQLIDELSTS